RRAGTARQYPRPPVRHTLPSRPERRHGARLHHLLRDHRDGEVRAARTRTQTAECLSRGHGGRGGRIRQGFYPCVRRFTPTTSRHVSSAPAATRSRRAPPSRTCTPKSAPPAIRSSRASSASWTPPDASSASTSAGRRPRGARLGLRLRRATRKPRTATIAVLAFWRPLGPHPPPLPR